jgi:integrase
MPRTTAQLTNTQIKNAKPREKEYALADGKGLLLRIKPTGGKSWIFNYIHPVTKKRKNLTLGTYPELSLSDARDMRANNRSLVAKFVDPKANKENIIVEERQRLLSTFELATRDWYELKKNKIAPKYAIEIIRSFEKHVFPSLGQTPITEMKARIVIDILKPVAAGGALETVRRLCQRINEVMVYSINIGLITTNPLLGIREAFITPTSKAMPSLKPNQLAKLMKDLSLANIRKVTRTLIEWQLHTMVRPGEAACAEWDEIDFDARTWTIPASKMKRKSNGEHVVPLTGQAMAILAFVGQITGRRKYIFPSDIDPKKHANASTSNMALKRMGYGGLLVAHGLRSLASSTLNEQGFDADVIESCLAHVDKNAVRRAYNRTDYLERRRKVMEWWSEHILRSATGNVSLAADSKNVVNFK